MKRDRRKPLFLAMISALVLFSFLLFEGGDPREEKNPKWMRLEYSLDRATMLTQNENRAGAQLTITVPKTSKKLISGSGNALWLDEKRFRLRYYCGFVPEPDRIIFTENLDPIKEGKYARYDFTFD